MQQINLSTIAQAVQRLEQFDRARQLSELKALCEQYGVWTIPLDGSNYSPVLYEISLFGVAALTDRIEQLPRNWIRAAKNILRAEMGGQAA